MNLSLLLLNLFSKTKTFWFCNCVLKQTDPLKLGPILTELLEPLDLLSSNRVHPTFLILRLESCLRYPISRMFPQSEPPILLTNSIFPSLFCIVTDFFHP